MVTVTNSTAAAVVAATLNVHSAGRVSIVLLGLSRGVHVVYLVELGVAGVT